MKEKLSSLAASEDWIHAKPLVGVGGGGGGGEGLAYTRFALWFVCLTLPHPFFFSYLGLVLSTSRLRTHMSRNSSLKSPGLSGVHWE